MKIHEPPTFIDGRYAIRRKNYSYLDLHFRRHNIWGEQDSQFFEDCLSTREIAESRIDKGEPVND